MKKLFYLFLAAMMLLPVVSCKKEFTEKTFVEFTQAVFEPKDRDLYLYNNGDDLSGGKIQLYKDWVRISFKDAGSVNDIYGNWTIVDTDKLKKGQVMVFATGSKLGWVKKGTVVVSNDGITVKAEMDDHLYIFSFPGFASEAEWILE